jgi:hypothetical protein
MRLGAPTGESVYGLLLALEGPTYREPRTLTEVPAAENSHSRRPNSGQGVDSSAASVLPMNENWGRDVYAHNDRCGSVLCQNHQKAGPAWSI